MKVRYHRFTVERSFRSPKAFAEYAQKQATKFGALRESNGNAFSWWGQSLQSNWQVAANAVLSHPDEPHAVQNQLNSNPVFAFESGLTRTLLEMTRHGRQSASQEIFPFLTAAREGRSAQNLNVGQFVAHAEFQLALALDKQSLAPGDTSLERLIADHEDRLLNILEADEIKLQEQRHDFEAFIAHARDVSENINQAAADFLHSAKAEWAETHASFIEQLATETAVDLWSRRSKNHETRYKTFRAWVLGFGGGGLLLAIGWIFGGFALARWAFEDDKTGQLASYTAGSIALFTLLVWGLRVLIRSMMSEDHLSTDASARSALAHTYLALIKEQAATDQDRAIILAALFAPVSDGLVKDDGMPAFSPASFAAQALTKP